MAEGGKQASAYFYEKTSSKLLLITALTCHLTVDDVLKVFEELLPAQDQSYELGLKLNLPPHEVESIHSTYTEPGKRLLQVIIQFLNQLEPRPTWRVIVDALKSSVVNLPQLGRAIEEKYFPNPASTSVFERTGKTALLFLHSL